jgi:hypothetical protein
MNLDGNLIARLMIDELPGLAGALQLSSGAAKSPSEPMRTPHRQNLANAILVAATRMLAPSLTPRYPLGPVQRLGPGLGALQSEVGAQGRILDAVGMEGGSLQSRTGVIARAGLTKTVPARAVSAAAVSQSACEERANSARRSAPSRVGRSTAAHRKAAGGPALRRFSGTLAHRLDYPAVLPGGWQLYGYEKESGRPVYVGPNRELRVYARSLTVESNRSEADLGQKRD